MSLPLEGLRVLDLSRVLAGPYATMVLGDLGADVLKVEHPERGDDTRHWGPPFAGGESAYFLAVNRNKRSLAADLKDPEELARVRELAAGADVVIENFRRGALERLGLGYEELREKNPALVYCSITGFGPGLDEGRPGYDFLIQARGGIMSVTGAEDGEPMKVGVAIADIVCGMYAATAILAAVRKREVTGEGSRIEVPLFETQLSWLANRAQEYLISGEEPRRFGNAHPTIVPYQTFEAADRTFALAVGNDSQFGKLCAAIGREELAADPRYATNPARVENRDELVAELERVFSERPADEWVEAIRKAGVPCGPVNTIPEALSDPHTASSDMLRELEHPAAGLLCLLASPVVVDGERPAVRRPPPTLGEHTGEGW
jgi:crotonobetainyl-CoA:carnitine CoA-transferase CaiB-like acyl-CoA transferase